MALPMIIHCKVLAQKPLIHNLWISRWNVRACVDPAGNLTMNPRLGPLPIHNFWPDKAILVFICSQGMLNGHLEMKHTVKLWWIFSITVIMAGWVAWGFVHIHLASSVSCDALFLCTIPLYDITVSYGMQCVPVQKTKSCLFCIYCFQLFCKANVGYYYLWVFMEDL